MHSGFLLLAIVVLSTPLMQAFGDEGYKWGFFQDLKKNYQGFVEYITVDPVKKQEVTLRHVAEWQQEKEKLIAQNQPIPQELETTIMEKKSDVENIQTQSTNSLSKLMDTVLIAKELGKIREYTATFHKLKTNEITESEKSSTISALESNVNNLELVKKHCTYVSVHELLSVQEPYDKIKSYCGILNDVPKPVAMSTLG